MLQMMGQTRPEHPPGRHELAAYTRGITSRDNVEEEPMNSPDTEPGGTLREEPQEARGAPGSRDKGEGPAGGPTDRPVGTSDAESDTKVNAQGTIQEDMPKMPAGDQGG